MKANLLRILSLALCMAMLLGMAPMVQMIPTASAVAPSTKGCCDDHASVTFVDLGGETEQDIVDPNLLAAGGAYKLQGNIKLSGIKAGTDSTKTGTVSMTEGSLHIDLNGYTIASIGSQLFSIAGTAVLTICDSDGDGKLQGMQATTNGMISMAGTGTVNLYGGKITGMSTTGKGGAVYLNASGATFNMHGGTISGNTAAFGGAICMPSGIVNMYGGSISDNIATKSGGGVFVLLTSAVFNMNGGTISGNQAQGEKNDTKYTHGSKEYACGDGGGGIYVYQGQVIINGGSISNNTAVLYGGGLRKQGSGASRYVELRSGEISGNTAAQGGGVWLNSGTFTVSGGQMLNNSASSSGGAIGAAGGTTVEVKGGLFSGNMVAGNSNSFYIAKTLNLSGNPVLEDPIAFRSGGAANISNLSYGARIVNNAALTVAENDSTVIETAVGSEYQYSYNASSDEVKHNLSLESEIDFSFFVAKADVPDTAGLTAAITHTLANGEAVEMAYTEWVEYPKNTDYYYFRYNGVDAKQMTEKLSFVVKNAEGAEVFTDTCTVKDYANQIIADNSENTNLCALMTELLNYGAAAQMYFDYNTQNLATAAPTAIATVPAQGDGLNNLSLESEIDFSFFVAKADVTDTSGLTATITHALTDGESITVTYTDWVEYPMNTDYYYFRYNGVDAKQMTEVLTLKVTDAEGKEVEALAAASSIQAYAQRRLADSQNDAEKILMTVLLEYGAAAQTYFGNYNSSNMADANLSYE